MSRAVRSSTRVRQRRSNSRKVSLSMPPARCRSLAASCNAAKARLQYFRLCLVIFFIFHDLCQRAFGNVGGHLLLAFREVHLRQLAVAFELVRFEVRPITLGKAVDEDRSRP